MVDAVSDDIEDPFINETNSHDTETRWQSIKSPAFLKLSIYGLLIAFSFQLPNIVMTQVGADYFHEDSSDNDNCSNGNAKFAYYSGIFDSVGGLLSFLFEGYLGRLSDVYGRKPVMYVTWACMFCGYFTMVFTKNIWIYLSFTPFLSLCGTLGGSPTVLQASIADSVQCKKNRTFVFALIFGIAGVFVVIAAVITPILTDRWGTSIAFYIFSGLMLIDLIWLIFVVEETLPKHKRMKTKAKYDNPCKIFKEIRSNKMIFWFAVVALITSIPETGLNDMMGNYCDEMLDLCNKDNGDNKLTEYNALFTGTLGAVMLITQLFILPIISKFINDTGLLIVGLFTLQIMMFSSGILFFFPNIIVSLSIWGAYGAAFMLSPVLDGSLSKRLNDEDQGVGIGVIHGVKGVTYVFAPYLFSGLYNLFDNDKWYVITPFIVGILIASIGFGIVLIPLRKVINEYDEKEIKANKVPVNDPQLTLNQ